MFTVVMVVMVVVVVVFVVGDGAGRRIGRTGRRTARLQTAAAAATRRRSGPAINRIQLLLLLLLLLFSRAAGGGGGSCCGNNQSLTVIEGWLNIRRSHARLDHGGSRSGGRRRRRRSRRRRRRRRQRRRGRYCCFVVGDWKDDTSFVGLFIGNEQAVVGWLVVAEVLVDDLAEQADEIGRQSAPDELLVGAAGQIGPSQMFKLFPIFG